MPKFPNKDLFQRLFLTAEALEGDRLGLENLKVVSLGSTGLVKAITPPSMLRQFVPGPDHCTT